MLVNQEKAKSEEKLRQQFAEEREQLQRTCDRRLAQLRQEFDSNQVSVYLCFFNTICFRSSSTNIQTIERLSKTAKTCCIAKM